MSKTNHGTVEVTVGEETFTLKPTLKAMKAIEGRFGGILPAMQSVGSANLSAISFIIAIGTGVNLAKKGAVDPIEEAVFEAGLGEVGSQVIPYLTGFLNPAGKTEAELEAQAESGNE
ncbi:MAG: hypothetical protein ACRER8_12285 [Pseudomonas sp.]|uniref:hypothetical protein n=1 Tax=Pseudomonas sp. TaxID=306 RepID=UPI003D6F8EB3